ncbi:hypothetical protein GB931_01875 [Modestobacter sp. I12A-02628]|uniref:Uncharacterized protein n=1 Tax=Goekera deserti TaxID=2497753 RepID=A0A7K3WII9_9ACTN|nr:hypothetical protein [Goekera deserti]MPQ96686.1 hypothetical protein [Goekera deserti]NDI47000.1 hypothetical protein [Goekera deserti]NEL56237.1 hypothetical protein [Goekera deserti]
MRIWKLIGLAGVAATGMMATRDDRGRPAAPDEEWGSMTLHVDPDMCAGPRHTPYPRETAGRRRSRATARH